MDFPMLEKLTIIIISYNRHKYLRDTLKYWSQYNVKVVVIDGSEKKLDCEYIFKSNINYVHDPRGFYERLLYSSNYIETEFMILASDDEFLLPSALSSCIKFLMQNTTYSCCGGRALGFRQIYGKGLFGEEVAHKLKDHLLDHESSIERLESHFSDYEMAHFWSVIRSSKWKIISEHVFQKEYNFGAAFELQVEFLVVVSGKSKILPELMWMRNREVEPILGVSPAFLPSNWIHHWWYQKNNYYEKLDLLNRMYKACIHISNGNKLTFNQDKIAKIFEIYIQGGYKKKYILSPLRKIINLLPNRIKSFLKKLRFLIKKNNISQISLIDSAKVIESEGVSVNYKDLNNMISVIETNHKY